MWHIEVPRLGVESELHLLAYTTATAMQDPSCISDLHHSSRPHQIPLMRPEIEPTSSWILVGFVPAEPQWELSQLPEFESVLCQLLHVLQKVRELLSAFIISLISQRGIKENALQRWYED